jgi:hypothetical protein
MRVLVSETQSGGKYVLDRSMIWDLIRKLVQLQLCVHSRKKLRKLTAMKVNQMTLWLRSLSRLVPKQRLTFEGHVFMNAFSVLSTARSRFQI